MSSKESTLYGGVSMSSSESCKLWVQSGEPAEEVKHLFGGAAGLSSIVNAYA